MRYFGGKEKIAARMAPTILAAAAGRPIWEPFCGGLSVSAALARAGARRLILTDANHSLIALYQALRDGWVPPADVSEADYAAAAKSLPDDDPRKAFALVGCSFAGKWGSGYAREKGVRNYAATAARSLARKFEAIAAAPYDLGCTTFAAETPEPGLLVYCDPPYAGATGYAGPGVPAWNPESFWARAREWAAAGSTVIVSEYQAPPDAREIWSLERGTQIRTRSGSERRVERMVRLG